MPDPRDARSFHRDNWPIAAAMIQYPNILPDGRSAQDQAAEEWAATLADVVEAGFTELDPTDGWLRIADLGPSRLAEFLAVVKGLGLTIPAVSTARKNLIDPDHGADYVAYGHRLIETAAAIGAGAVSFGFFGPLTTAQKKALWFWTVQGEKNPDDKASWDLAVARVRDLGRHAESVGVDVSLEMYEDTYLGTADDAVRFVTEVDVPCVGLNPDLGNLIRLHRPVEHWLAMVEKTVPFARYWHVKNYLRTEDATTGLIVTAPTSLELGLINYRVAIRKAIEHGFNSAFLVEHYGGDGVSVSASNRDYLRRILPRASAASTF